MPGKVTLVGAGPGDPGLLTRKGLEALERADVVVYDRLVSPAILALMPEGAVKINVGKEASRHPVPQEQINRILLEQAQQGHNVVRLKGGDPFLFGRGGEELELLAEHRIPFEVTRNPVFAGAGMSDGLAKRCGIDKETPARTGVPTGMVVKMEPEFKREMRRYCSDMCVTPNGLVHMLLGQVAFELRVPFNDRGERATSNRIARSQGRGRKTRGDSGPAEITGSTTRAPGKSAAQTAEMR